MYRYICMYALGFVVGGYDKRVLQNRLCCVCT